MGTSTGGSYDPREFRALTYHDVLPRLRDGSENPPTSSAAWRRLRRGSPRCRHS
jgi:hypothetical protein